MQTRSRIAREMPIVRASCQLSVVKRYLAFEDNGLALRTKCVVRAGLEDPSASLGGGKDSAILPGRIDYCRVFRLN
jgi:hypothetical protein